MGNLSLNPDTLEPLLCPESIAVLGASRTPGKVGHEVMANLLAGKYEGQIIPVNPSADEVQGVTSYKQLGDYSGRIDLSVIALPAPLVPDAVEDSLKAKAGAIAILAAGFGESGSDGARAQSQIAEKCREAGTRLLGPNCLGLINTHHKMNASFSKAMPRQGTVSLLSQSGALCTAMLDWAASRHLGLAKVVSIGNKADLDETDLLAALAADEQTKVIVGYMENISDGEKFVQVARAAAAEKPFILLRAGFTKAGMWAASAHTGNLAGNDVAYNAAFRRAGVIRAESFDALFDYAAALSMQPLPRSGRVAIITNAGGPGVMAADAVEGAGMKVASLNSASAELLKKQLPAGASIYNPIDVLGDADPGRYAAAVEAAQTDEAVDAIIVILTPHAMTHSGETARAVAKRTNGDKPILMVLLGEAESKAERQALAECRLPTYPSPERAVAALRAMNEYRQWKSRPARVVTRFAVNRRRVERIITRHLRTGLSKIGEVQSKEILRAYGFNVPDGQIATTIDEAIEIAQRIGFPVAMKVISPDIVHKSDVGGIKLNISSAEQMRDTFDLLTLRVSRRAPQARLEGVYIEKMCAESLKVVIGMTNDPKFGPMLIFGLGGIFVDVLKDCAHYLAPITAEEATQMLMETRSYSMLQAAKGQSDVDISSITEALQRISQLAMDFPQIKELNVNPYIVGGAGSRPTVVDACITLSRDNGK